MISWKKIITARKQIIFLMQEFFQINQKKQIPLGTCEKDKKQAIKKRGKHKTAKTYIKRTQLYSKSNVIKHFYIHHLIKQIPREKSLALLWLIYSIQVILSCVFTCCLSHADHWRRIYILRILIKPEISQENQILQYI